MTVAGTPPWRRPWASFLGVNLVFGLLHPSLPIGVSELPPYPASLAVNAALFLLPAFGWNRLLGRTTRGLGLRLARDMMISTAVFFASLTAIRVTGATLSAASAWSTIWVLTNVGFAFAAWRAPTPAHRRSLVAREAVLAATLFLASYTLFFWGATSVVPAQEDQDLEVMATGYGLVTRFEPLLLTDRAGVYFFAHPPLLHFYVGGSFLLHGELEELAFYDDASRRVRDAREGRPVTTTAALAALEGVELERIYARYNERPHRLEARTPNLFFGAAVVALLALWIGRISRRWWLGLLAAVAYVTTPEVFVRSSYGGYFAAGSLATLVLLLAAEHWKRWPVWRRGGLVLASGACAALADHKLVFLPATLAVVVLVRSWPSRTSAWRLVHPGAVGFAAGIAAFWVWGLSIAPAAFIRDHLRDHLLDRITHTNPLGYGGYPAPLALWAELLQHTAWLLLPVGIGLMVYDFWTVRTPARSAEPSRGTWLLWIAITAVAFTMVDWRMTKHLVPLLLPAMIGFAPRPDAPAWRVVAPVCAMGFAILLNLPELARLVGDFGSFVVTPAW